MKLRSHPSIRDIRREHCEAAAKAYIKCQEMGINQTQLDIAREYSITEGTVRKYVKKIREERLERTMT